MKIINLISGPRNLSTALMYSFSRRPDTKVVDEPFYAHYLSTTGIDHPGREETLSYMSSDIDKIISDIFSTKNCDVLFLKNPRQLLKKLCDKLRIEFYEDMLSWDKGGIKEDGPWSEFWYKNVHNSTGFVKQKTSSRELPKNCQSLYIESLKYYNKLTVNSIKV